jgi:hypothetical protein
MVVVITPNNNHMTIHVKSLGYLLILSAAIALSSCYTDDPGPLQETERHYAVADFDRIEMGDAFIVNVLQGNFFEVSARGDRRNVEDITVRKEGNTLVILYRQNKHRRYDTHITITMPELYAVNFSGASDSRVSGFGAVESFDVFLSGASRLQLDIEADQINTVLSGASYLNLRGAGDILEADVSGASVLKAFNFPVLQADLNVSGASDGNVTVSDHLAVIATGGSHVSYRGEPTVDSDVSGSSSVHHD